MKEITEKEAINLLKKYAPSEEAFHKVLNHVKAVQKVAIRIASKCHGVDMYTIKIGSLLHDIGRLICPPGNEGIKHGIVGGKILRKEGLPDMARIAERHIGAGITKKDIIEQNLPLPKRDFLPETKEEKIIAHADNFIFDEQERCFDDVTNRFRNELGEKYVQRIKRLKEEVDRMQENKRNYRVRKKFS